MKTACKYFCLAAGTLSHLKSRVIPDMRATPPDDMDITTLECLEQLMLAQAQECFWQKAVKDGMKDAIVAKLAAKVSDLYSTASDWGIKSEAISSEWIHHMTAKHHHFAAAAQYRQACDCLERRKYGEEVARLRDSLACANEGLKEARYVNRIVSGDLNGLKHKVQDDLSRAEKDNDMIYLMPVPTKPELQTLQRASMVSSKTDKEVSDPVSMLGDGDGELGKPLFAKLVPYAVHLAASIYSSRRDQKVGNTVEELENLNSRIHGLLHSLNLPGSLQALEKPLGLPPGLVSHAEEVRQQNGPTRLRTSMDDIDKLKRNDLAIFQDGIGLLESEAKEDDAARRKHGTSRWTRNFSQEAAPNIYSQVKEIEGYFKTADTTDSTVRTKYKDNIRLIKLLNGTNRELEDHVPSSGRRAPLPPKVEREVNRLRDCLNSINRLEGRRQRKVESLRSKAHVDDVNPDLLKEAGRIEREHPMQKIEASHFEDFFERRLESRYSTDRKTLIRDEKSEQDELLSRVAEANTALNMAKRGDDALTSKEREKALQELENAFFAYGEIIDNLNVGRKFYNDLAPIVGRFKEDCAAFAWQRHDELEKLENDIEMSLPLSRMSLGGQQQASTGTSGQDSRRQTRQSARQASHAAPAETPALSARNEQPLAAPTPVKPQAPAAPALAAAASPGPSGSGPAGMWAPEMGIKFAGTPPQQALNGAAPGRKGQGQWDPNQGLKFG